MADSHEYNEDRQQELMALLRSDRWKELLGGQPLTLQPNKPTSATRLKCGTVKRNSDGTRVDAWMFGTLKPGRQPPGKVPYSVNFVRVDDKGRYVPVYREHIRFYEHLKYKHWLPDLGHMDYSQADHDRTERRFRDFLLAIYDTALPDQKAIYSIPANEKKGKSMTNENSSEASESEASDDYSDDEPSIKMEELDDGSRANKRTRTSRAPSPIDTGASERYPMRNTRRTASSNRAREHARDEIAVAAPGSGISRTPAADNAAQLHPAQSNAVPNLFTNLPHSEADFSIKEFAIDHRAPGLSQSHVYLEGKEKGERHWFPRDVTLWKASDFLLWGELQEWVGSPERPVVID